MLGERDKKMNRILVNNVSNLDKVSVSSRDVGRAYKTQRLEEKLMKVKKMLELEFETEALKELEEIKNSFKTHFSAAHGFMMANFYYKLRKFQDCLHVLESIKADENRKKPKILNLKGLCHMKMGNIQYAIDLFEMSIDMDPHYKVAYNNLGNIYLEKKEYERSKEYFRISKKSRFC